MRSRGFVAVIALAGLFAGVAGPATPAAAADGPLITATGFTDGQLLGVNNEVEPTVSDEVVRIEVLVDGKLRLRQNWPLLNPRVSFANEDEGRDVDLTVRAFDTEGAFDDAVTRLRVDITPARFTIAPQSFTIVHGRTDLTVKTDADDLAEVVMTENDGTVIDRLTEAPWVFHWDATGHSGKLRFTGKDKAGNRWIPAGLDYQVDDVGPEIELEQGIYAKPGAGFLSARFPDLSGTTRTEWWIDGALRGTDSYVRYNFGTKLRTVPVEIRAWDKWGNASVKKVGIRLDGTKPVVTRVSPGHLALVRGTRVTTTITATDAGGIQGVWFSDGRGPGEESAVTRAGDTFTATAKMWSEGENTFNWVVYDIAGNETYYNRSVIVDNTLPKITSVSAPASNAKVPSTVKTTMAATDRNGILRTELRVNGKLVLSDAKAPYNLNLDATKYGKSFTVAFYAIDRAGNVVSSSRRTWKR